MNHRYLFVLIALLLSSLMGHAQDLIRDSQAGLRPSSADPSSVLVQELKTLRTPGGVQRPF